MPPVDNRFARALEALVGVSVYLILQMMGVVVFTPVFLFPALVVAAGGLISGNIYMKAQLCVKRELGSSREARYEPIDDMGTKTYRSGTGTTQAYHYR